MTGLLDPRSIRQLAAEIGLRPTKQRGQNFVHDANTVRRIVAAAGLAEGERVLEVGPGLGSLTLALLDARHEVVAVEIEPALAARLPRTVAERMPERASRLRVLELDALRLATTHFRPPPNEAANTRDSSRARPVSTNSTDDSPPGHPSSPAPDALVATDSTYDSPPGHPSSPAPAAPLATDSTSDSPPDHPSSPAPATPLATDSTSDVPDALVANLPYNVSVPVILHVLATFPSIRHGLVLVQAEVADRLVAAPGSRTYGAPSAKLAWYAQARRVGSVPPTVFWPVPNVESGLVAFERRDPPAADVSREWVFKVVDAAFAQRRKMLRSALAGLAGSAATAVAALERAGIDPQARGETLGIDAFAGLALALADLR